MCPAVDCPETTAFVEKEPMNLATRLAAAPALVLAITGLTAASAHATTDPLSAEAVGALAQASCQLDPTAPLSAADLNPVVVAESDVTVIPGELTAHLVRADVNTSLGDVQECTFGVLHRDALLSQVAYDGTATLALGDGLGGSVASAVTDVELGNMGRGGHVDPTAEVPLNGFLVPTASVVEDPTYAFSIDRKALEVVPIAVDRPVKDAAGRLLNAQVKAAAQLEKKQVKAAKSKHSAKAVAAAQRAYDKRVAEAQAAYTRATAPKSVTRPVSHHVAVSGAISVA